MTARSLVKRAATVLVVWTSFDGRVATRDTTFEDAAEHSVDGSSRHHILFLYLSLYVTKEILLILQREQRVNVRRKVLLLSKMNYEFGVTRDYSFYSQAEIVVKESDDCT